MCNEEKSLRLLAESKSKSIESVQNNVKTELKLLSDQVHKKNVEIDALKKQVIILTIEIWYVIQHYLYNFMLQLDEVNSDLREKNAMFYTLQIESEKVIKELNRMKADITETISQKQLLKEANVRLTAQLEAMVEDSNVS